ncbi:MAG: hypothetical protein WKF50_03195 [Nocardioides sp.]
MAFTPGFYIPDALPPPPGGGGGDIDIDPAALEQLKTALRTAAESLETDRFSDVHLDDGAFGGCPSGAELGAEHRTAHQIIADTISGVVTDLWGYRDGVEQFEAGMGTADDTAAADLKAREVAVEALAASATSNHGESQYHNSQVNHLPPDAGPDPGPGGGDEVGVDVEGGSD